MICSYTCLTGFEPVINSFCAKILPRGCNQLRLPFRHKQDKNNVAFLYDVGKANPISYTMRTEAVHWYAVRVLRSPRERGCCSQDRIRTCNVYAVDSASLNLYDQLLTRLNICRHLTMLLVFPSCHPFLVLVG